MTDKAHAPLKARQHQATAHFPGSGPPGLTCRTCQHLTVMTGGARCKKWGELMHVQTKKIPSISRLTPACKYFEAREKK